MPDPRVTLRAEREEDLPFAARVYATTRADEMALVPWSDEEKEAFLAQQFAAQRQHYLSHYAEAAYDLVLLDGEPVGRLYVARWEGELRVMDIALLPEARGRGIGTGLLRDLLAEAAARGDRVTAHVEREGRALRLYIRLGFVPVDDVGFYLRLEWRPPGAGDQVKIAS